MTARTDAPDAVQRRQVLRESRLARYERMVEIRVLEDKMLALFGEGVIAGTMHTAQGQEAVAVGVASVTTEQDTVTCTYRGHGVALAMGMSPRAVVGEILGRTSGCLQGLGGSMHLCDPDVGLLPTFAIVGAGIPIAVGAALTSQVLGRGTVAVAFFGDGATNIGAFHEALNLASVWTLPVVFVCENNGYGSHSRLSKTTPVEQLSVRASSYAMTSETVDGQVLDDVRAAAGRAVERARSGGGPTLIEAKTYRYAGHSRSDDNSYRPAGELESWQERDPIESYGRALQAEGVGAETLEAIWTESRDRVEAVVAEVLATPAPTPEMMLQNIVAAPARPSC